MNSIFILSFTRKGYDLAKRIEDILERDFELNVRAYRVSNLKEFMQSNFGKGSAFIFVGAAGIAVRAISPFIQAKTKDPAVIVIDEMGQYVIPILSGHIGGANRLANKIAELTGAIPVITTATDINGVFSIDVFASERGYSIVNPSEIKYVSSSLLEGKEVGLFSDFEIDGCLPNNVVLKKSGGVGICISDKYQNIFDKTLHLKPKQFHIGVGTRKNIPFEVFESLILETLNRESISIEGVRTVSSIDLKKSEQAIIKFTSSYGIEFITYSAGELSKFDDRFAQSKFVKDTTGVGNVCETSAYISSRKGEIILGKTAQYGVTMAIAKESWRVSFENIYDRT